MAQDSDPQNPPSVRDAIRTQHPGIANEIQGAINTLRKLQKITTGSTAGEPADGKAGNPAAHSAPDSTMVLSSGAERQSDNLLSNTSVDQEGDSSVPSLAAGESFGRYQVARLLGRGAMGAVYLAYDCQLQRYVALKTPSLGNNPQTIGRFHREARATAQLRSPYICPIYDVGQIGGVYYLSMAFIDGRVLSQVIAEGKLKDHKDIATVTKKIARGLQKAHEQGVIHRDLKPDNIMIDSEGDPIVMDFGLARRVDDEVLLTTPGKILGTPAYMSPEQVEGDPNKIGPPTDIYSLGVVLYQMLTGRLPFQGPLTSVLRQIGNDEPPRPAMIRPEIGENSPLEQICLRMIAKVPAHRFESMSEVAKALETLDSCEVTRVTAPTRTHFWSRLRSYFGLGSQPANPPAEPNPPVEPPLSSPGTSLLESSRAQPAAPAGKPDGPQAVDLLRTRDS
jgi:serine/threonine protein kinase